MPQTYKKGLAECLRIITHGHPRAILGAIDSLDEDSQPTSTNFKLLYSPKNDNFNLDEQIEFIPLGKGKITMVSFDHQPCHLFFGVFTND